MAIETSTLWLPLKNQLKVKGGTGNPFIIIGILNTDRARDFTPTNSLERFKGYHPTSSGAENFLQFLTQELRIKINNTYRASGNNMLLGHSFGGLFTMYTFIHHTQAFDAYIAHDPSFWWDNDVLFKDCAKRWSAIDADGKTLYVSMASNSEEQIDANLHSTTMKFCTDYLNKQLLSGLRTKSVVFKNENHGSIVLPASLGTIRFVFGR